MFGGPVHGSFSGSRPLKISFCTKTQVKNIETIFDKNEKFDKGIDQELGNKILLIWKGLCMCLLHINWTTVMSCMLKLINHLLPVYY